MRGAADMHVGLSEVLIERNELDDAARHLAISDELGESAGLPQHAYRWRVVMARLCRARGDLERALELIDEAAPRYDTDFSPPVIDGWHNRKRGTVRLATARHPSWSAAENSLLPPPGSVLSHDRDVNALVSSACIPSAT